MRDEIVIFSRSLPMHGLGGMEIVAWDLACELAKSESKVYIITTSIKDKPTTFIEEGVNVVALKNTPPGRYSKKWWRASRVYFESHHIGTVKSVLSVSASGFGILSCKKHLEEVPFVFQAHGTSWGECVSKWKSRNLKKIVTSLKNLIWLPKDMLAYRKFDYIVAVGKKAYEDLNRPPISWSLKQENLKLINNGIDNKIFNSGCIKNVRSELGFKDESFILISASRLHSQKGIGHGLLAFKEFLKESPEAIYLIAGDGPEKENIVKYVKRLKINESVFFLGRLGRKELSKYLQASNIFVFLTEHVEVGISLNLLEAMAVGLPLVVSEHLSLFENEKIHKVNPRDYSGVAKAYTNLFNTEEENKPYLPKNHTLSYATKEYIKILANNKQ